MSRFLLASLALTMIVAIFGVGSNLNAQTVYYPCGQTTSYYSTSGYYNQRMAGYEFQVNVDGVQVTKLGIMFYDPNGWYGNRVLQLFEVPAAGGGIFLGSVTPTITQNGVWVFANLAAPIPLTKNKKYCVVSFATSSVPNPYYSYYYYANGNNPPGMFPTGEIAFQRSVYCDSVTTTGVMPSVNTWNASQNWAYVDIGYIKGATLTASVTLGSQLNLYPAEQGFNGDGTMVGRFSIRNNNVLGQTATLNTITVQGGGTGDHITAYNSFQIYRDDGDNLFDAALDTLIDTQPGLTDPAESKVFTVPAGQQIFAADDNRTYLLVVKLAGTAQYNEVYTFSISDIGVGPSTAKAGVPTLSMAGFRVTYTPFFIIDHSPGTPPDVYSDGQRHVVFDFTIDYTQGAVRTLTALNVMAFGTGNDVTDVTAVELYRDTDGSTTFDVANDDLIEAEASFPVDDGLLTFDFPSSPVDQQTFTAGESRRYFLVYTFTRTLDDGLTFQAQLTGCTESSVSLDINPNPCPFLGPNTGVTVLNQNLNAIYIGPATQTVANNAQGPLNRGLVLLEVDVAAYGVPWTVISLTFSASGTGDDQFDYNSLVLMEDYNAGTPNGIYDGQPQDLVASPTAPTAFPSDDGTFTATLSGGGIYGQNFPPGVTRKFFLVVKLIGTASPGDTFSAQLVSINAASAPPPNQGTFMGSTPLLPPAPPPALIIDVPLVTVGLGSGSPASTSREQGDDFAHLIAKFRFTCSGAPASVDAINLAAHGTADFAGDLAQNIGVEVWQDDGNGIFDPLLDILKFAGTGGATVTVCNFVSPMIIPNGASRDLWIRLNVLAAAGGSVPDTFQVALDSPLDVSAGSAVVQFAAEAPVSGTLSVVVFAVESFEPRLAYQEGGQSIYILGSGFSMPVTLTIGGVSCPGSAVVSPDGRQITGLIVPPGTGKDLMIKLKTGGLSEKTLSQTFSYAGGTQINSFDHTSTCSAAQSSGAAWLVLPAVLLAVAVRRRRTARKS
ncbi:MAG: IPT/TIG domain-containing protein [Planctomycetes bacterium]|nr:IPT/TIG domain-containing protein [Planctomycetota bacterium]